MSGGGGHANGGVAKESLAHRQLLSLAAGLVGLQFCWAVQVGYNTKSILQLGLAPRWTGVVWLAGPIAGIVVQPLVGVASDACASPSGRRRPFIVAGTAITVAALTTFAYAREIGAATGASPLFVAIASFWALDFAINAAQGPLRALMADLAPPEQQTEGNAYFAFATGVGNVAGGALGSVSLSRYLPIFRSDGQALYMTAAAALVACIAWLVVNTDETPLAPSASLPSATAGYSSVAASEEVALAVAAAAALPVDAPSPTFTLTDADAPSDAAAATTCLARSASSASSTSSSTLNNSPLAIHRDPTCDLPPSATLWAVFAAAPRDFHLAFVMQCFTWFAYFTMFIFATSYMGAEVFQGIATAEVGSSERDLYNAGVRLGNFALAMQALVSMAASLVVPTLVARFSAQVVLFLSHLLLGTVLASTLLLHSYNVRYVVVAGLALIGIPWAGQLEKLQVGIFCPSFFFSDTVKPMRTNLSLIFAHGCASSSETPRSDDVSSVGYGFLSDIEVFP